MGREGLCRGPSLKCDGHDVTEAPVSRKKPILLAITESLLSSKDCCLFGYSEVHTELTSRIFIFIHNLKIEITQREINLFI